MKKLFIHFVLLSFGITLNILVHAQTAFPTSDTLTINNIRPRVMVHGDMWWNPDIGVAACEFPPGSGKSINFAGALWMSGYDASNNLHVAAQTYRQNGNDYWPGPLDGSDTLTYATSYDWAKIWKVNKSDIQSFLALPTHTVINTPLSILTWPGKGNSYAQGNGGAALTITNDMAPFEDLNSNGIYEPLLGEYPAIPGDQAMWWMFSDNGPSHNCSNGKPLGVEVHAMSYGYSRGTLIDDVVYYEYDIVNRSPNTYTNFRVAQWDDMDLGYYYDDFVGFDSTWRMGIGYNSTNCDGCSAGHPVNSYGENPPQAAVTMIVLPGDNGTDYVPPGSFTYYNNDYSIIGNPSVDTQYNNCMRSKLPNGKPIASIFSSGTPPCGGFDSTANIKYALPGDPSNPAGWSECNCGYTSGDRRFVLASNDFTLNAGATAKIVLALIVADTARGCDTTSFNDIRIVADTAWGNYFNLVATGVKNVPANSGLKLYPNPAHDQFTIENTGGNLGLESITLYNVLGQQVNAPINKTGQKDEINVSGLPPGMYYVQYRNNSMQTSLKFVKQ